MLEQNDLQAISEPASASEERISAIFAEREERFKADFDEVITRETDRYIAFIDSVIVPKFDEIIEKVNLLRNYI